MMFHNDDGKTMQISSVEITGPEQRKSCSIYGRAELKPCVMFGTLYLVPILE